MDEFDLEEFKVEEQSPKTVLLLKMEEAVRGERVKAKRVQNFEKRASKLEKIIKIMMQVKFYRD